MPSKPSTVKKAVKSIAKMGKTPTQPAAQLAEDCPRTVRPRQLHINDKIRLVYTANPASSGTEDAGLLEWLNSQDEQSSAAPGRAARVAVVGHTFKPIPAVLEAPELQHAAAAVKPSAAAQDNGPPIVTPSFVNVQTYQDQEGLNAAKSAYIRYVVPTPDDQEATVEYDLDEEDEDWLQEHNLRANKKLSEDDLERLIDALEKMHHAEIQKHPEQWANLIGSPLMARGKGKGKGSSSQALLLPEVDTVLPLNHALQALPDQQPAAVKAVYQHWCSKRSGSDRPLLQRLWYEPPWHRLTVAGSKGSMKDATDADDDIVPFSGQDDRRPLRARKTMQLQDVDAVLRDMRGDLEQARILADQVQHREKLRKRALLSWQQNMRLLAARAATLDKQKAGSSLPTASKTQAASVKKALSSFEELARSEDGMRAKFEHDMALSLELTETVAEEAGRLQHVKIICAEPSQPELASDAASLDPNGIHQVQEVTDMLPIGVAGHTEAAQQAAELPAAGSLQEPSQAALLQSSPRMTRSMLVSLTDADQPADCDVARRHGQSPPGPAQQSSPRLTRSMQTQLPQPEQQPTGPTSLAKHPASGKTPASASEGRHQSPPSSQQLASPRLTRSRQVQQPDVAQDTAAMSTVARHPALGTKPDGTPRGSPQQPLQASLQLMSPRVTRSQQAQLAEPAQEPAELQSIRQSGAAHMLATESGDIDRAPDNSAQVTLPRMTRYMQAQLADANASSAVSRSAPGSQNNMWQSAPAGPEKSPRAAPHTSPIAKDVSPVDTASLTAKSAAASHNISPRQTRSGLAFASVSHQLPGTRPDTGTPAILSPGPQQHLQIPAHRQSSRLLHSDAGNADVNTAGAESSLAPTSMPSSAQRQQRLSLSSGRPSKAHSHQKNKSVRWSLSVHGPSPHHSATRLSPSPSSKQQPDTAHQQLAPPVYMQRTTVDRGCDPISFSDCSTSDCEPETAQHSDKGTAKAHLPSQREQPVTGAASSCQKCGQGKAGKAAGSAPQSRGYKRRLEVSPLAEDTRRVSRRLNSEPTCVLPHTRAAANMIGTAQHSSVRARAKQTSSTPTQAVPTPALSRAVKASSEQSRAKQTQTQQAVPRQTRQASAAKPIANAVTQAKAPQLAKTAMPVVSDGADVTRRVAFRDAAVLKSRDASGKFIKGALSSVDGNMTRSSNDARASASGQGKPVSARQAADRLAKQSACRGKHNGRRPGLQLAVTHSAAHSLRGRQQAPAKQHGPVATKRLARNAVAKSPARREDAGPSETETATRHTQQAGAAQSAPATLDASSMQLLQQAVVDRRLGCPKCRYAQPGCKKCRATFLKQNGGPAMPRSCMPDARTLGFAQPQAAQQSAHKLICLPASTHCASAPAKSRQQERGKSKAAAASDVKQQAASPVRGNGRKRKEQQDAQQALLKKQKTGSQQQSSSQQQQQQQLIQKHTRGSKAAGKQVSVPSCATSALQHQLPSSSKSAVVGLQQKGVHQGDTPAARDQQRHASHTSSKNQSAVGQPAASDRHRKLSAQNLQLARQATGHHRSASARSSAAAAKPAAADQPAAQHAKSSKPATKVTFTASSAQQPSAKFIPARSVPVKSAPAITAPENTAPVKTRKPSTASKTQPRKPSALRGLSPVSVKAGKPLPAAKIKTSKAGVSSAAGQAVAGVLDSKLGCSKCRYVPGGCTKCRAKQAGQLLATKCTAKRQ